MVATSGRIAEEIALPPKVIREEQMRRFRAAQEDHELDIKHVNEVFEVRFRLYWLVALWVMLMFQSAIMFLVMGSMTSDAVNYGIIEHLMASTVCIGAIAVLALVYRFVLFPNSRWMPQKLYAQPVVDPKPQAQEAA